MTAVREPAAVPAAPPPAAGGTVLAAAAAPAAPPLGGQAPPPGGDRRRPPPVTMGELVARTVGTSLLILAVTALGFVAWVGLFSTLHYDKAQLNAYDALRVELALGTAPTGPTAPNSTALLAMGAPVAVLSIPAIGLRTVILQGTTGSVLEDGPGHLRTTVMPGQAGISVILGRQTTYGGPFRHIAGLVPGDSIKVVTGQTVATYKVIDLRRAGDPLPPPLADGAGRMVLVTADGSPLDPTGTLYVDADQTSKPQASPGVLLSQFLSPTENAMATDSGAWLPIVLWGQLLVIIAGGLSWLWTAWGKWQTWVIAVPAVSFLMLAIADQAVRLLPNLM